MKHWQNILITFLFSLSILTAVTSKAEDDQELVDLQVESEIQSADAAFDMAYAKNSKEILSVERRTHKSEIPRLREEIRQAQVAQKWAQKQTSSNQQQATQLENERKAALSQYNFAQGQLQKTDRLLKSAQGHLERRQKARDIIVEKRNQAIQRMNQRIDASQLLVAKVEQAELELKQAEAQYQKTLKRENEQKIALAKKQANLKKRIAEATIKSIRVKNQMKKLVVGRAG